MTIRAIRLRNVRGFTDAKLELKPLTVLLGPNSSGKSAFGHLLAAMAHAQWRHAGGNQATLTPRNATDSSEWPIDLGSLDDLRTNGVKDRAYVDLETGFGWAKFGFGSVDSSSDGLRLSYLHHPTSLVESASRSLPEPTALQLTLGQPSSAGAITDAKPTTADAGMEFVRRDEVIWLDGSKVEYQVGLDGLLLQTVRHIGRTDIPLNVPSIGELRQLLQGLGYLRGVRERPTRGYERRPAVERTAVGYAGEYTASVLHTDGSQREVEHARPPQYPDRQANPTEDDGWKLTRNNLEDAVGFWLAHLGLASRALARDSVRYAGFIETQVLMAGGAVPRDITEVGFGISQVVPVLVAGLLQAKDSMFVVDLPEAHLHPRPQGALADFFCSLVAAGRTALVETHSDMFFHRLRLRAAMDPTLKGQIAVYFIDPPKDGRCQIPREVGLDLNDEIRWPPSFLQEAWEVEDQIRAARLSRPGPQP